MHVQLVLIATNRLLFEKIVSRVETHQLWFLYHLLNHEYQIRMLTRHAGSAQSCLQRPPSSQFGKKDLGIRRCNNRKVEQSILLVLVEAAISISGWGGIYTQSSSKLLWEPNDSDWTLRSGMNVMTGIECCGVMKDVVNAHKFFFIFLSSGNFGGHSRDLKAYHGEI